MWILSVLRRKSFIEKYSDVLIPDSRIAGFSSWPVYLSSRYTSVAGISPWHVYFHDGYASVAGKPLQDDYRFWIKLTAGNYQACFTKINAFVQSGSE